MKIFEARHAGLPALGIALAGFFGVSAAASAQYPSEDRYQGRVLETQSYERMRQYAHELDGLAQHAREQAHAQEGGYRGFRRDTKFLRSIDHFADRTDRFHEQMDTYQTQPWAVDDEIDHLLRDARNVQYRLRRARFVDRHTAEDWNNVVGLLNRMAAEYRAGIGYGSPDAYGNRYPGNAYPGHPAPTYPGEYGHPAPGSVPDPHRPGGTYGYGQATDLRELAHELDERAARAASLAGRYNFSGESASNIQHLSEQARFFHDQIDNNRLGGSELRAQLVHLLEDAQSAQDEMRRMNVGPDLADEWNAIVQILTRMRDLARV
jgi:hypothetical protein